MASPITLEDLRLELEKFSRELLRTELNQMKADLISELALGKSERLNNNHFSWERVESDESYLGSDEPKMARTSTAHSSKAISSIFADTEYADLAQEFGDPEDGQIEADWAVRLTKSLYFQNTIITLIMSSLVSFIMQIDYRARNWSHHVPFSFFVVDTVFQVIFTFEIMLRVRADGWDFWTGHHRGWNLFDLFLVLLQSSEMVLNALQISYGSAFIGSLRILRVSRVLRIGRLLHQVPPMRMLFVSIMSSLASLMWILLLVLITCVAFAVVITQIVTDHKLEMGREEIEKHQDELESFFGTVPRSTFRMYQIISEGEHWDHFADPLMKYISPWCVTIFLAYTAFMTFAMMNVVTAFFVETAMEEANRDLQTYMSARLWEAIHELDVNHDREVSEEEFMSHCETAAMTAYFKRLDLDADKAKDMNFFQLIDKDQSGSVTSEEMMHGCLKLMGNAKALDVAALLREVREESKKNEQHRHWIVKTLRGLRTQGTPLEKLKL